MTESRGATRRLDVPPGRAGRLMVAVAALMALLVAGAYSPGRAAAQTDGFADVASDFFAAGHIAELAADGIFDATECRPGRFCPDAPIDRQTMAVWTVRMIDGRDPRPVAGTRFDDVDATGFHAPFVERMAELGVTAGCGDGTRYCPDESVSRAQMAVFLSRAYSLPDGPDPGFSDVAAGAWYAAEVSGLAASRITAGCGDGTRFCPDEDTTRAEMAVFLSRAANLPGSRLTVEIESAAPRLVQGDFDVAITFSEPVDGFSASALQVVNGAVSSLTGGGARYRATITPRAPGSVLARVRPGAVSTAAGRSSPASDPLIRTWVADSARHRPGIDTWDRAAVVASYASEFDRAEAEAGYTGDSDRCVAGTTSQAFRDGVVQRVNWYRQMSGLGTVTERPEYSAAAQQAALIMAAQGQLSHRPPSDWACYRDLGARAASQSNLHLTWSSGPVAIAGIETVSGYMQDSGAHNVEVGHRRWILYPQTLEIGTGDALHAGGGDYRYSNALHVLDDNIWAARPEVREPRGFVAWPSAGYVPSQAVWGRWSFSLQHADFSVAAVAVSDDSGDVQVEVIARDSGGGAPEAAIVWAVGGDTDSDLLPAPDDGDHCYAVTISGVRINTVTQTPYEYAVCVLDPGPQLADQHQDARHAPAARRGGGSRPGSQSCRGQYYTARVPAMPHLAPRRSRGTGLAPSDGAGHDEDGEAADEVAPVCRRRLGQRGRVRVRHRVPVADRSPSGRGRSRVGLPEHAVGQPELVVGGLHPVAGHLGVGLLAEETLVHEREVSQVQEVLDDARARRLHRRRVEDVDLAGSDG